MTRWISTILARVAPPWLAIGSAPPSVAIRRPLDAGPAARPASLPSLDVGRFVAAFLVLLFHFGMMVRDRAHVMPVEGIFRSGHAGVEYFFVLSGFILYYVHRGDFSRPERAGSFFRKRATRILPFLWLTMIGWIAIRAVLAAWTSPIDIGPGTFVLDMLLIPHAGPRVLAASWTLQLELVFYLLFAVAILNRTIGLRLLLGWQALIVVLLPFHPQLPPILAGTVDVHNLGFGLGVGVALLVTLGLDVRGVPMIPIGVGAFLVLMLVEWRVGGAYDGSVRPLGETLSPILYSLAAAALVLGLAARDIAGPVRVQRWLKHLGGSSYTLYLVHAPAGAILSNALARTPLVRSPELMLVALAVPVVALALVLHLYVEVPVLAWLKPGSRVLGGIAAAVDQPLLSPSQPLPATLPRLVATKGGSCMLPRTLALHSIPEALA